MNIASIASQLTTLSKSQKLICLTFSIFVAGKDGSIHILNTNYVEILKVETSKLIEESLNHRIRSIDCTSDSRNIVIGTQGSEIFRLKTNDAKINKLTRFNYDVVTQGHSSTSVKNIDEVWGLATFSDGDRYCSNFHFSYLKGLLQYQMIRL